VAGSGIGDSSGDSQLFHVQRGSSRRRFITSATSRRRRCLSSDLCIVSKVGHYGRE
jgi:hypothetical protein